MVNLPLLSVAMTLPPASLRVTLTKLLGLFAVTCGSICQLYVPPVLYRPPVLSRVVTGSHVVPSFFEYSMTIVFTTPAAGLETHVIGTASCPTPEDQLSPAAGEVTVTTSMLKVAFDTSVPTTVAVRPVARNLDLGVLLVAANSRNSPVIGITGDVLVDQYPGVSTIDGIPEPELDCTGRSPPGDGVEAARGNRLATVRCNQAHSIKSLKVGGHILCCGHRDETFVIRGHRVTSRPTIGSRPEERPGVGVGHEFDLGSCVVILGAICCPDGRGDDGRVAVDAARHTLSYNLSCAVRRHGG